MIDVDKLKYYKNELKNRTFKYGESVDLMLLEDTVRIIDKYLDNLCSEEELLLELSDTCIPNNNESDWLCSNKDVDDDKCIDCWRRYLE